MEKRATFHKGFFKIQDFMLKETIIPATKLHMEYSI